MSERHKRIHEVNTDFRAGENRDQRCHDRTLTGIDATRMVNFLKPTVHVAPRLQSMWGLGESSSCPHRNAASRWPGWSYSAMQCADHYFQTAVRNR